MLGRSFLLPGHPHFHATPLSLFLFFHLFRHHRPLPACQPACLPASSLASLLLFTSPPLSSPLLSSLRRSLCPGIVQLKCRNCPLEFILKFAARQPFISLLAMFRETRFARDIQSSIRNVTHLYYPAIRGKNSSRTSIKIRAFGWIKFHAS